MTSRVLTAEQSAYAKVVSEAHGHFTEVLALTSSRRLKPIFKTQYAALSLRIAIEAVAFAAIAPKKKAYEGIRGDKIATDWRIKNIFKELEKLNDNFFPLALTGPTRTANGALQYGGHSPEPFMREDAENAYDSVSNVLHATNPWGGGNPRTDENWLAGTAEKGILLLDFHAAFIRADTFRGCWIVKRQQNGDWRFLTAEAQGDFIVDPSP